MYGNTAGAVRQRSQAVGLCDGPEVGERCAHRGCRISIQRGVYRPWSCGPWFYTAIAGGFTPANLLFLVWHTQLSSNGSWPLDVQSIQPSLVYGSQGRP